MGYREHAIREFEHVGWTKDGEFLDGMQEMMCNQVLELLDLHASHGHSGSSAPYALSLFTSLAKFEPIGGINCTDDEWVEVGENRYQNSRLGGVFKKGKDGKPYYLDAIIWKEENGSCFTGHVEELSSGQKIRLPFRPKSFYIDVIEENGERRIKDRKQLDAAKEYYLFEED